jgi:creatinine amidohydrolase/Fe(II)-dependent formamide hydrolase-like protein
VVGGRGDEEGGRQRGAEKHGQVDAALESAQAGEALRERDDEEKGEQHLDPRQGDPKLAEKLVEVAVESLGRRLVARERALKLIEFDHPISVFPTRCR